MKKFLIILLALFIGSFYTATAQKDSTTIRNLLEERDNEIKELLGPKGTKYTPETRQKLKDIINGVIDYSSMAEHALQQTYDTLTEQEREEFIDYFSTIIRDQSLNKLDIYRADVRYNEINVNGDSAKVNTIAILENVRTPVIYDMYYQGQAGQWVITDMTIDDVSTADSYQRQFQNIIRKRGYDYLLATLQKRAAK
ncbi:MAG: ABC transporter substrate-binding protein [Balneolaceae bacterium]|nr:ABC transporter substrate-binding protein [Balneolaceae bacterium]